MTNQKYVPQDNQWIAFNEFDSAAFAAAVYDQAGGSGYLSVNADGTVEFDPDDLPTGVSENDVKQAVRDNHPHR